MYYDDDLFPPDGTYADGGDGDDIVKGHNADDFLYGGAGNDLIEGGMGDDAMYGNDGQDIMRGDHGDDQLVAGAGRDLLEGGRGADRMFGQDGHDVLRGDYGEDALFGGDGNDLLTGGASSDNFVWVRFEGGAERDRITDFEAGENGDRLLLGKTFQEKSGIDDFDDFIHHAEQNDTGVYVDFSGGRHYSYGVQIDGIEIGDLVEGNVAFDVDDYGTF
ncbi:type I secretion C-terminal target domain-containing protein [Thalassospiraceae bacterium SW-3-3]|nr:type I secretion C-terminal target domain-containing protein [Thalassospiraceae bacterium SW-3-3]